MNTQKTYDAGKLGRVTIPEPDETDNPRWISIEIAKKLEAQRDELLAALKPLLNAYVGAIGIADPADDALCLNASCAIAKAESNQT